MTETKTAVPAKGMKIIEFHAENFKRLSVVQIRPTGNVIEIVGRNGNGKSSTLDAIEAVFEGARHIPAMPIRRGQKESHITIKIGGEAVELVVRRRFTEAGTTLTVETASGARKTKPQDILNGLIGALSFDPLEFSRMDARTQFNTLCKLVNLGTDLDELTGLNKRDFDTRTDVNRDGKSLRTQADAIVVPDDLPAEAINTAAILDELTAVADHNAAIDKEIQRRLDLVKGIDGIRQKATAARLRAEELRRHAAEEERIADSADQEVGAATNALDALPVAPDRKDANELRSRHAEAEKTNIHIMARTRRASLTRQAEEKEKESEKLTAAIADREQTKITAIAAAKMPVDGLSFGDGTVLLNDVPFEQASDAEKIRVGMAIAMAANPTLRVIRIHDGSLLDDDTMKVIEEMAVAGDYQVWCERVLASGPSGIVLEDGHVKGAPPPAEPETPSPDAKTPDQPTLV